MAQTKRTTKIAEKTNVSDPRDRCQTPAYALDPLRPYLPAAATIWEPSAGEGSLVRTLTHIGHTVIGSDLLTGQNFFKWKPTEPWDLIVTNPPYSVKYDYLARCYGLGKPFALLVPVETIGAGRAQKLFRDFGGPELLLLDKRVNFKMPYQGFEGSGANFPVLWLCHQLLPASICFGSIVYRADEQLAMALPVADSTHGERQMGLGL